MRKLDSSRIERQSDALIRELARESNQPLEEVRGIYESQLQQLEGSARIKNFLPILAARRARAVLASR